MDLQMLDSLCWIYICCCNEGKLSAVVNALRLLGALRSQVERHHVYD